MFSSLDVFVFTLGLTNFGAHGRMARCFRSVPAAAAASTTAPGTNS